MPRLRTAVMLVTFFLGVFAGLVPGLVPGIALADVAVSLQPAESCAGPDETFTVTITVDQEGSAFDGYEAVVLFDPEYLEVESLSQNGMLIQELCGTTWWYTEVEDSTIFISHVALCGGDSLTGPGPLSSITFRAAGPFGLTDIAFDYVEFYRSGSEVPCSWTDAVARIQSEPCVGACCFSDMSCELLAAEECLTADGDFLGYESTCDPNPCEFSGADGIPGHASDSETIGAPGIRLAAPANPSGRQAHIEFELDAAGHVRADVLDATGRLVRRLLARELAAGTYRLEWDGRTREGMTAAPGAYFVRLSRDAQVVTRRLILID